MEKLLRFLKEEQGMETVEWAVVAALIILVAAGVFTTLGTAVVTTLTQLVTAAT